MERSSASQCSAHLATSRLANRAWPVNTGSEHSGASITTTIVHDHQEARETERRVSKGTISSQSILQKKSFEVKFDLIEALESTGSDLPRVRKPMTAVWDIGLSDVGSLLSEE